MKKKYIANSDISLSVTFKDGSTKHVSFSSRTSGGSVYYSNDEKEQKAIEAHPKFGKLFKIDKSFNQTVPVKKEQPVAPVKKGRNQVTEIKVTDIADAKNYLCERLEISRTKLRYLKNIIDVATANNIKFIGI